MNGPLNVKKVKIYIQEVHVKRILLDMVQKITTG